MKVNRNIKNLNIKKYYNREVIILLVQHVAVLILGFTIFLLEEYEQLPNHINLTILLSVALLKAVYFTIGNFKNIQTVRQKDKSFNHFLILTGMNIILIVFSFALDYYCINILVPGSISGLLASHGLEQFFDCIYFSIVTFSTTGFGDIAPTNVFSRFLVSMEIMVAFISTIFIIANYANFRPTSVFQETNDNYER